MSSLPPLSNAVSAPSAPARFFRGARSLLWVPGVLLTVALQASSGSPYNGTYYLAAMVLAAMIVIAFWAAHVQACRFGAAARPVWRVLVNLYALSWRGCVVLVAAAFVTPHYQDMRPRMQVVEMLSAGQPVREEMERRFASGTPMARIGAGLKIPLEGRIAAAVVAGDGTITLASTAPPVVLMLTPTLAPAASGASGRSCTGTPMHLTPAPCR